MIYFDLDGVLRDLAGVLFGGEPDTWVVGVTEMIDKNKELLVKAKPTEYYYVVIKFSPIVVITAQLDSWRSYTDEWIRTYLPDAKVIYTEKLAEKLSFIKDGDYLVEDFPLFKDYSRIVLIDRKYNRNVKCPIRIKNPAELWEFLVDYANSSKDFKLRERR